MKNSLGDTMYEVHLEAVRRASVVSRDRFSQKDSEAADEHVVAAIRECETLPVLKSVKGLSWAECVFQIFFSIQGPAFFVVPASFMAVGYGLGIAGAFAIGLFYVYMVQLYLWCEKELRQRNAIPQPTRLDIYSLVELVFVGTPRQRRLAAALNAYLKYEIVLSWSFSLSFGLLFVCQNIRFILNYFGYTTSDRIILLGMFPVTTFISWVPNLKVMSFVAYFSSLSMVLVMFEIMYFVAVDPAPLSAVRAVNDVGQLPNYVATIFFTIIATPLVFPLKNEMKKPQLMGSHCGSFNASMAIAIVLNVFFSLFGYLKYGADTSTNILQNLPANPIMMGSNCLLTVAMIACGAISFFVVFETVWNGQLERLFVGSPHVKVYEYAARTMVNLLITVTPLLIPTCGIFINLISSFSYPYDSVFLPILLHGILLWRGCDGKPNLTFVLFMLLNVPILAITASFSVVSFSNSVSALIQYYSP